MKDSWFGGKSLMTTEVCYRLTAENNIIKQPMNHTLTVHTILIKSLGSLELEPDDALQVHILGQQPIHFFYRMYPPAHDGSRMIKLMTNLYVDMLCQVRVDHFIGSEKTAIGIYSDVYIYGYNNLLQ